MKHLSSLKAGTILIITLLFVFLLIATPTAAQNNSTTEGVIKKFSDDPVIYPKNNTPGVSKPPTMQGSNSVHLAKFDLMVTLEPNNPLREDNVTLNITFLNKDAMKKSLIVQYIKIDLLPIFNVTRIYSNNTDDRSNQNKIRIPQFFANRNNAVSFKYDIHIPKNAALNIKSLIDHQEFNKTELFSIIAIKKCRLDGKSIYLKDDIFIRNNPPIIETANVSINAHQLAPMDEETLLVAENLTDPLNAVFNISARDIEDGKSLRYGYFLSRITGLGRENETTMKELAPCGDFSHEISIQPGVIYSLWVEAKDSDNETIKKQAFINYNGDIYKALLVPGVTLLDYSALILIVIVTIIITIIIFYRIGNCRQRFLTRNRIIISIIITWLLYFILTWSVSLTKMPILEKYLFFNTIQHFELAIYITEFIIITSFIEACFFLEDLIDFHDNALWINYISTLVILILFIFIIPERAGALSLSNYYATMSTLMGTIFALVVTLSTQFPKNIFTSPIVKCTKSGVASNPADESTDAEDIFSYPKKLRYFVKLYGVALVISLLGLVIGTNIEFGTRILNPPQLNPYNLLSVALFETTFLLIPPTVISLYHLMEVISFRGKITIRSDPSGAMVFLSKIHKEKSSPRYSAAKEKLDRFFKIDHAEACIIEEPHRLDLRTPCTLMLMKGTYNLKLQMNSEDMEPVQIQIRDAVEKELMINLMDQNSKEAQK